MTATTSLFLHKVNCHVGPNKSKLNDYVKRYKLGNTKLNSYANKLNFRTPKVKHTSGCNLISFCFWLTTSEALMPWTCYCNDCDFVFAIGLCTFPDISLLKYGFVFENLIFSLAWRIAILTCLDCDANLDFFTQFPMQWMSLSPLLWTKNFSPFLWFEVEVSLAHD